MKQQNLEVVDLGLPSGTLWMKCNIGAEKETDYGKYFQWGDIEGRYADEVNDKPCNWRNAPFNDGSVRFNVNYFNEHKHEFVDYDGILRPKHDTAFMNTHGLMRMPTKEQLEELVANTFVTWKENFNGSGVNGRKFTSKTDSTKYIFIPDAGHTIHGHIYYDSIVVHVWSSSLDTSNPYNVWILGYHCGSGEVSSGYVRYYGRSVRGVISK